RLAERSIVVNREVVIQPTGPNDAGQRPDILVDAVPPQPTLNTPTITIPIEIKGSWHKNLLTAPHDQLLPYIRMTNSTAGIYLVAWFPLDQWTATGDGPARRRATVHTSAAHLLETLQAQAIRINHTTGVHITPYVLTVSTTTPSTILDMYESAARDEWK
ncbi:hypothetical protein, partial [Nocardia amikacinitolerans]|uniref:hypothetical protein n=1 Tax=Nocardia amikacinitolerans TaxID=756689 RepID=UPI000ADA3E3B